MKELILGIDPGSHRTGFGLLRTDGDAIEHIDHGIMQLDARQPLAQRLCVLHAELLKLYAKYPVTVTAVEKVFLGKSADSAFKLGHARGVCLLAAAQHRSRMVEYAARFVKKCVTGSGAADKGHVQLVVQTLVFGRSGLAMVADASDALALAITASRLNEVEQRMRQQGLPSKEKSL